MPRRAVIIGAGPAGLTAAFELLDRTDVVPTVIEAGSQVGGISRSERHGPHFIDLGGHRFFSKHSRVMDWWMARLPVEGHAGGTLAYQGRTSPLAPAPGPDPNDVEPIFLVRERRSRILHRGRLFDYPLRLDPATLRRLGLRQTSRIGASYLAARRKPRPEATLEDFLINRFGKVLYETFFRDYTEKVWGQPCDQISADWGAQRIKSLDLAGAVRDWFRRVLPSPPPDLVQVQTPTSLVERFLYPKRGPGQLWEAVAAEVVRRGGTILLNTSAAALLRQGPGLRGVEVTETSGPSRELPADFVFSSMALRDLVPALRGGTTAPAAVSAVAQGLVYRDFLTVALLSRAVPRDPDHDGPLLDNWLYVQEPGYQAGRVQLMHNWSPWMRGAADAGWLGIEYFGNAADGFLDQRDADLVALATREVERMGLLLPGDIIDAHPVRVPRAYPAYFGSYAQLPVLRAWLQDIPNLIPIGRNGLHRYNNQDHSMLTAMVAVDAIAAGQADLSAVWDVNTDDAYIEEGVDLRREG
jgi:protoporphyrinogen oxidase